MGCVFTSMQKVKFQSRCIVGLTSNFGIPFAQWRNGSGGVDQEKNNSIPETKCRLKAIGLFSGIARLGGGQE